MVSYGNYIELFLVELPAIELLTSLGFIRLNCLHETLNPSGIVGLETFSDFVLIRRLRESLLKLNSSLLYKAIDFAIKKLTHGIGILIPAYPNSKIYSYAGWINPLSKELSNE